MKLIFKALLLCMLAVAVPFQGYAFAAMSACQKAGGATHQPASGSHHAAATDAAEYEEHCAPAADNGTIQPGHAGHGAGDDGDSPERGCSATCIATALHTTGAKLQLTDADLAPAATPEWFIPDVEPSRLERPPKRA